MTSKTYQVPDVSCGHCKAAIEQALGRMDGIQAVAVDVEAKKVDVSFDEQQLSEADIFRVLEEEGYPVTQ